MENDTALFDKTMAIKGGKRIISALLVVAVCAALPACRGYKQIPEEELSDIFRDMYMVNAYIDRQPLSLYGSAMNLDSIDVYAPVLEKYGYNTKDFTKTIAEATKRKSFRLTDVVESALKKLEAEYNAVSEKVRVLEFIDSLAYANSGVVIYQDSLIKIRNKANLSRAKVTIPLEQGGGKFDVTYYYELDSLDQNSGLQNKHYLLTPDSIKKSISSVSLRQKGRVKYSTTMMGADDANALELTFGNYPDKPKNIHLTIDSLVVVRMLPLEEAKEALLRKYIDYRLVVDGKEYNEYINPKADSCALHILPPGIDPKCDSLAVK